jgi:hypothetical protein
MADKFIPPQSGGSYVKGPGDKEPKKVEGTTDHPEGNWARPVDDIPPKPPAPSAPATKKEG